MSWSFRPKFGALALIGSAALLGGAVIARTTLTEEQARTPVQGLREASSFENIADRAQRSAALFTEAGKVITGPRCMNCHPATRRPTQGEDMHPHMPPMFAQEKGNGPDGLACSTCHGPENVATLDPGIKSIPGDPHWALAPASMAWQGKTLREICEQIKDPARNGKRSLAAIVHHMSEDHLVGWAWRPGPGRTPAAGTQESFGRLIAAWVQTGAHCPASTSG